jgi:anti-anti-sigma factor
VPPRDTLSIVEFSLSPHGSAGDAPERVEVEVAAADPVVVRVTGRLLFDTLPPLAEALSGPIPQACPRVVLDLSAVPMCDSSALNLLVRTWSTLTDAGGWLRLAGTQPLVDRVLEITNLTRILPRYSTADAAAEE